MEDTKTTISRAFESAARWQIITTMLLVLVALVLFGVHAAASVFVGGTAVVFGGYIAVTTARKKANAAPGTILITLLKAELVRIMVIAVVLLIAFKYYKELVPLALIGGLTAAVLISGAALRTLGNENY